MAFPCGDTADILQDFARKLGTSLEKLAAVSNQGFTGGNLLPRDACSILKVAEESELNQCYISLAKYSALLFLAVHF